MRALRSGSFVIRHSSFVILALSLLTTCLGAAPPPEPFLRLRETTLGYHGSETDFKNLTEIRIGWFGPTNLDDALTGDLWWAANLAVREANTRAGTEGGSSVAHLPFRLVPRWSVDPWGTGVSQLTRMVYEEPPLALIGSVDSATTHLAEQVVAKANLPLVSPIATDKSLTLAGVSWVFSCAPSDRENARVLVEDVLASASVKRTKLALLNCTDHESRMTTREVLKEFSRQGCLPAFRLEFSPDTHAIGQQMTALNEAHPDAVVIVAGPEDAARLVCAVRENLGCSIFGSHSMARARFQELAGPAAEGVRFPILFVPDSADTNAAPFIERFSAERHRLPDYTAALTYDATRLLIASIQRAGPNRARIRESLTQLSPWPGVAGVIHFDGTGQNSRTNVRMGIIRNGKTVPLMNQTSEAAL